MCSSKPTIFLICKTKEVKPSMIGMPKAEIAHSGKCHIVGCIADMPTHRKLTRRGGV